MNEGQSFETLIATLRTLRSPEGCPWDREQTAESLLPYFLEESYEVIEAVESETWPTVQEELGDILLHVVFQGLIAEEEGRFSLTDSLDTVIQKMITRHPHVFGDKQAESAFYAKQNWEAEKHKEKKRHSRLDGVPPALPGLVRAQRLQEKASYVGFDWDRVEQVWEKIHEEIAELREAEAAGNRPHLEEEIGDVLFAIVNLARFFNISAEGAIRKTNAKFLRRFKRVEEELRKQDIPIEEASLVAMDAIWDEVKREEKSG
ncbi:MAG: nucleoside triphosphate pyrophosphohydrolase [Fidelibacterota bacterium]